MTKQNLKKVIQKFWFCDIHDLFMAHEQMTLEQNIILQDFFFDKHLISLKIYSI